MNSWLFASALGPSQGEARANPKRIQEAVARCKNEGDPEAPHLILLPISPSLALKYTLLSSTKIVLKSAFENRHPAKSLEDKEASIIKTKIFKFRDNYMTMRKDLLDQMLTSH